MSRSQRSAPADNGEPEHGEAEEFFHHIVVAVDKTSKDTVGCAYYSAQHDCIFCMEDLEMGGVEVFESLMMELQPTIVIASPRVATNRDADVDGWTLRENSLFGPLQPLPFEIINRPPSDFRYESAIKQILSSYRPPQGDQDIQFLVPAAGVSSDVQSVLDSIDFIEDRGKLVSISVSLELENKISIGCVGAVLSHVHRNESLAIASHDSGLGGSLRFEMFSLKHLMLVNSDTISSLQVMDFESHPSAAKQGPGCSGAKESLSVYGLFRNLARTSQGKTRLRQIFLRPLLDLEMIGKRLDAVTILNSTTNYPISERMSKSLTKIKDLRWTMKNIRKGVESTGHPSTNISSSVWSILIEFCYYAIDLASQLSELGGVANQCFLYQATQDFDKDQLQEVGKLVFDTVDLEETAEQQRTVIKRGLNPDLDQVKDVYNNMDSLLSGVARDITNTIPGNSIITLNVVFFPQLGFHIAIPHDPRTGRPIKQMPSEDWRRHFSTEKHLFVKNDIMRRMDVELGDLWGEICAKEIEMSHELAQEVLRHEEILLTISRTCGELDALLALAHGAVQYQLVRPSLVPENVIDIRAGRHILQELTVPTFIPNDTLLAGGSGSILLGPSMIVLTGPNYSGKSIYQKQVALIVYLAQVGSFVPAEAVKLGLTDKILTRIATRESASRTQSAFLIDLQQISRALHSCTNRSLLIVDEFGKGTNTSDGAAIAAATLEYLVSKDDNCPRVVASTHFHEVFDLVELNNLDRVAFMKMHVHTPDAIDASNPDDVVYLYNLVPGRSDCSYGSYCALRNGIPLSVATRASDIAGVISRGEDLAMACANLSSADVEDLQDAESIARQFLRLDLSLTSSVEQALGSFEGDDF